MVFPSSKFQRIDGRLGRLVQRGVVGARFGSTACVGRLPAPDSRPARN